MNLEDALDKLVVWAPRKLAFPPTPRIIHAARDVANRLRDIRATVDVIDLDDLRDRLFQARTTGKWDVISKRDWRYVADCLSSGVSPLIDDAGFLDEYLERLSEQRSRRAVSRLIRYYLTHFEPKHPGIIKIAAYLQQAVLQWRWQWAEQRETIDLFDVSRAPADLVRHVMKSKETAVEAMESIGLNASLYRSKIAGHGYIAGAADLKNSITSQPNASLPAIKRFTAWGLVNNQFAFDSTTGAAARMAEALLLPWVDRQPPEESQAFIESHLLSLLHDLRIDRSRWIDVNEEAKRVMRRWLTKASLEQFLDVVDQTAQSHMWPARRKFWSAYYEHKYMLEAWVAFASNGASVARRLAATLENPAIGNFGLLASGGGVVREHAVLIMQIGELVVADWSHNGKCHVWLPGNDDAPKLYKRSYGRHDLVNGADFDKKHLGAWQTDVYNFIRRNTGVKMMTKDYM